MFCKNCGKNIQNDSNFCQHCATPVFNSLPSENKNDLEQPTTLPLDTSQKNVLAKELRTFFRIIGISVLITFLSVFIILRVNSNNDSGLVYGIDRDALISRNQTDEVKDKTPKIFIYSLIILTLGRYVFKSFLWAESKNQNSTPTTESNTEHNLKNEQKSPIDVKTPELIAQEKKEFEEARESNKKIEAISKWLLIGVTLLLLILFLFS